MRQREDFKLYLFPYDKDLAAFNLCVRWLRGKPVWTVAGIDKFCKDMGGSFDERKDIKRNLIHAYGTIMLARAAGHFDIEYSDAGNPYIAMRTTLGDILNHED